MNPAFKKSPLGRGIDVLIPRAQTREGLGVAQIAITDIRPNPRQPRSDFDDEALAALTESIRNKGVLHPLVAYRTAEGGCMLISGERRLRASGLAGLRKVPVLIVEEPSDNNKLELALIENTQRDDLKPLELAKAYSALIAEFGYTHEAIASIAGKARSTVTNTLRLLELDRRVADALEKKQIDQGHARVFLTLSQENIGKLLAAVLAKNLSVRATEAMAKTMTSPKKAKKVLSPDEIALEKEFEEYSGLHVSLRKKSRGGGVIELHFRNIDELDTIINKIRGR
ncbi:MAG: ParB/RepB/Spo0J family partition protein [Deferribacteraceae bacterium]|nr:ParB/RepB/Spo0J family partition protein [Deferribacteraceae bacterium]